MREIKFRQPIFVKGNFAYWHYWGFISNGHFASPETNSNSIEKAREQSQQFTGLRDKNGKEIYEGDILNALMHPGRYYGYHNVFVEYLDGCFQFLNVNDSTDGYYWFDINSKDCEVIGNIYENPALLQ